MLILQSLLVFVLTSKCATAATEHFNNTEIYTNHQLWKVEGLTRLQAGKIQKLEEDGTIDIFEHSVHKLTFRVSPENVELVGETLTNLDLGWSVLIKDLKLYLDNFENVKPRKKKTNPKVLSTDRYLTLEEIEEYMDNVDTSELSVTKTSIGKSVENRDIWMISIKSLTETINSTVFVEGGIHAREWISPAVTLYLIEQLLKLPDLVKNTEFKFVPMSNPDGYVYTHTTERLWRKNRKINAGSSCVGVDLNRNWDFQFGVSGSSSSPCSNVYKGTSGFSEPETTALKNAMLSSTNVEFVLAIHSYGQLILYPWGYSTSVVAPDVARLKEFGEEFAKEIKASDGKVYDVINSADLYPASGATDDWAYGVLNSKYAYTLELRDKGWFGFELPDNQIEETGKEIWEGFKNRIESFYSGTGTGTGSQNFWEFILSLFPPYLSDIICLMFSC